MRFFYFDHMENFTIYNPTCLYFGKNVIKDLGKAISDTGAKKILFMYGKGSIKNNGIYNAVTKQLNLASAGFTEYHGIKANPVVDDVEKAAGIGRAAQVDLVLAVGGGSVIDSAKITALCIREPHKPWDIMKAKARAASALPVIAVLTLAATGTEMNPYAVLQNTQTREKIGYGCNLMFPKYSFLDPQYTYSVPADQTAYGIVDLIAHTLEAWFGQGDASLSDRFIISIIREAMEVAPLAIRHPDNYGYRSGIMLAATCALNGIPAFGRSACDWGVHDIGHTLSFLYDIPHGASLSIAYPAWLKLQKEKLHNRISLLGKNLFNVETADETITCLENFFKSIGCPVSLEDCNIKKDKKNEIFSLMAENKVSGFVHKLTTDDCLKISELIFS